MNRNILWLSALLLFVGQAFASTIAVIDSGVDYKHKDLSARMWANPNQQTTDSDGTVYKDDLHGWNFAEQNNQIIDYKYLGTFSSDCYKIFEVQSKVLQGQATADEKDWYQSKKKDESFLKELQKFGNFVHGTHVSGISTQKADDSRVVALKLIPTETPGARAARIANALKNDPAFDRATDPMVLLLLTVLAKQQTQLLVTVGKYTQAVKAEIANGSFGTSVAAVKPVIASLVKQMLGKDPTDAELNDYAIFLVQQIAANSKDFVGAAKDTLFVFAAGNDGTDNDSLPASPANVKADNTITVAATIGYQALATFSNYGSTMVEVAAPGVAIRSTIPGDAYLPMSGTSMAAPFVTNVAGLVKDANRQLGAVQIKKVLVQTVDIKPFLSGKVASSGIVNLNRAVRAAQLSVSMDLDAAIAQAKREVADVREDRMDVRGIQRDILVTPLPDPLFSER